MRPGFESRTGNVFAALSLRAARESGCTARATRGMSRLAQLVERKTLNLVVVGSSPTVGAPFFFSPRSTSGNPSAPLRPPPESALVAQLVEHGSNKPRVGGSSPSWSMSALLFAPPNVSPPGESHSALRSQQQALVAQLVEHGSNKPRVGGSSPSWSMIGWMAERSKALVSGTSLFGGVGSNPTPVILLLAFALPKFFCKKKKRLPGASGFRSPYLVLAKHALFRLS